MTNPTIKQQQAENSTPQSSFQPEDYASGTSKAMAVEDPATSQHVVQIGSYIVGDAQDSLLVGHPDIRY